MRPALVLLLIAAAPASAQVQWTPAEQARIARGQAAVAAWSGCVRAAGQRFARQSRETADVVAEAALGSCGAEERGLRAAYADSLKVLDDAAERTAEQMRQMRETLRARTIAEVIEARS